MFSGVSDGESPSESHDNEADPDDVWVLQAQPKPSNSMTSKIRNTAQQPLQPPNPLGKKHALKKYDQFALNTIAAFGEVSDHILPQLRDFMKFLFKKYE